MGCTDRESNFQRSVFHDGKWWMTVGYTPSWEGPLEEIATIFPELHEPSFVHEDQVYSVERTPDATVIVRSIGQVVLDRG